MDYIVKAIGILFLVVGVLSMVRPATVRTLMEFAKVGKRCYMFGALRLAVGIVLLFAIPSSTVPLIPGIIGGIATLSGIFIFAIGLQRVSAIINWWQQKTDKTLRYVFIAPMVIGILLIYSV